MGGKWRSVPPARLPVQSKTLGLSVLVRGGRRYRPDDSIDRVGRCSTRVLGKDRRVAVITSYPVFVQIVCTGEAARFHAGSRRGRRVGAIRRRMPCSKVRGQEMAKGSARMGVSSVWDVRVLGCEAGSPSDQTSMNAGQPRQNRAPPTISPASSPVAMKTGTRISSMLVVRRPPRRWSASGVRLKSAEV